MIEVTSSNHVFAGHGICDASSDAADAAADRALVGIQRDEALSLLASASYGRVVFTRDALPAIRPVNHLVDGGVVVVRTQLVSRVTDKVRSDPDVVVAYEADDIDPASQMGWSVVVTGIARPITDPERIARYEKLLRAWPDRDVEVIGIEPTIVTGVRLVGVPDQEPAAGRRSSIEGSNLSARS